MICKLGVIAVVCLALGMVARAADIAGAWEGTVQGPQGDFNLVFHFTVDGEKLGGTVDGPGGAMNITKGTIKGDDLAFNVDLDANTTITHEGKVNGETIAMKSHGPWGDSQFTLKRAANK
jgi:hypothetical protein